MIPEETETTDTVTPLHPTAGFFSIIIQQASSHLYQPPYTIMLLTLHVLQGAGGPHVIMSLTLHVLQGAGGCGCVPLVCW